LKPDYNVFMNVQQAINLQLVRRFAEHGIKFAFPTQTLYLNRSASQARKSADGESWTIFKDFLAIAPVK